MRRAVVAGLAFTAMWGACSASAWERRGPFTQYGCYRNHFHRHTHAGYHCERGPLAGQEFDNMTDLVKALKAQGIDPSKRAPAKQPDQ
jgi:hypothetical protein